MRTGKKLKSRLYGVPLLLVFLIVLITYFVINLVINAYATSLAQQNIETRFKRLDAYYNYNAYEGYYEQNDAFIITVRHMIFNDSKKLLYPHPPWETEEERNQTAEISSLYSGGDLTLTDGRGKKLTIGKKTYYIIQRTYIGKYDGAYIVKNGANQAYPVLAYIDITPIASFLRLINRLLVLLMVTLSLVSAVFLLIVSRDLDRSFQSLKSYIQKTGERKSVGSPPLLSYTEFNEIADTVYQMSCMIAKAEAAQVKFFQNASHELRTPLTSIRGYAEGISAGVIQNAKASANIIIEHSDKMSSLVDELLYISKIDTCTEAVPQETFDLKETMGRCICIITGKANNIGLRINVEADEQPVYLFGNEEMIERAIQNILSNALRYAHSEISASLTTRKGYAILTIIDDGDGISDKDLPHIFERFYKCKGGMTGIGLSITQEVMRRHNGTVTASTKDGHTIFTVTLPLKST